MTQSPISEQAPGHSILVIDSGVGGFSVCQSILALRPDLRIIYFADDAQFPYGIKPEAELVQRLLEVVSHMLSQHQPELVVLACNTVSTLLLPELRKRFSIPFVGVVPAIKPAAALSQKKCIGLLATPATVSRPYTDQLIEDYAADCEVFKVGSRALVVEAEALFKGEQPDLGLIAESLAPFIDDSGNARVDTVVLGCTHFPLLKESLSEVLPSVSWVDSGGAIARRVDSLLPVIPGMNDREPVHEVYFSGSLPDEATASRYLSGLGLVRSRLHLCRIR